MAEEIKNDWMGNIGTKRKDEQQQEELLWGFGLNWLVEDVGLELALTRNA
eukprot:CAMPEP_0171753808 /NCGR_PEP_ID=MMETSP0991-20121206/43445_1 /TAXON_ID=483369 /ORGANISM="non described non described, Strain CCMP2098" /LENGTH=49 /DNA_ID= /DNA_START= /DNA_END= /DNA_ORIENTATION=